MPRLPLPPVKLKNLKERQRTRDATGGDCFAVACDVRDYEQVEQMHKQVDRPFWSNDVLLTMLLETLSRRPKIYRAMHLIPLWISC